MGEARNGLALLVTQACGWIMDLHMFVNHNVHSGFWGWRGLLLRCFNSLNVGSEHMALKPPPRELALAGLYQQAAHQLLTELGNQNCSLQ